MGGWTRALLVGLLGVVLPACGTTAPGPDGAGPPPAGPATSAAAPEDAPTTLAASPSVAAAPATAWRRLADAPLAVTEVAGASHAGEVWAAGGLDAEGQGSVAVQRFSPRTGAWGRGPELPVAVHHAALVSTGPTLLLLGGYEGSDFSTPSARVWVLEDEERGWQPGPDLPDARAAGAAAFDGSSVVYGGGVGAAGLAGDVWRLDGQTWTRVGLLKQPREHLAAAGAAGLVWFMGGRLAGLDSNLGAVDVVDGEAVRDLGAPLPPAGGVAGFAHPDGRGCLVGGEDPGATIATVACVDREGTVTALPDLSVARHGLAVAVVDGVAHAVLGGPTPGLFVSPVAEALPLEG